MDIELLPQSLIFFVCQRFDQPLCRRPPAGKGRDDDAGTTGGEIAVKSAPDISTVAHGNERSRQRLAQPILSTLGFAAPYQVSQRNKFIAVFWTLGFDHSVRIAPKALHKDSAGIAQSSRTVFMGAASGNRRQFQLVRIAPGFV